MLPYFLHVHAIYSYPGVVPLLHPLRDSLYGLHPTSQRVAPASLINSQTKSGCLRFNLTLLILGHHCCPPLKFLRVLPCPSVSQVTTWPVSFTCYLSFPALPGQSDYSSFLQIWCIWYCHFPVSAYPYPRVSDTTSTLKSYVPVTYNCPSRVQTCTCMLKGFFHSTQITTQNPAFKQIGCPKIIIYIYILFPSFALHCTMSLFK